MVVVIIATSGVLVVRHSYKALRLQKQQDELVMAKNIAVQVEEALTKARKAVEALARMPTIQNMDPDRQVDALTIVTQTTELIDGIVITDPSGRIKAIDAEINTERIMPKAGSSSSYRNFAKSISRSRSSMISEVYLSKSNEVCVAINAPIYSDGGFVGMVSGGILLRNHSMGGIDNIRIGNTGYAYVVDASGDLILHPQREKTLEDYSTNPAVKEFLATKKSGVIEFENQEGIGVVAAFAPIEETGWGVVVRQPGSESYAFADHIHLTLWIFLGVGVLLSLGLGFFLAQRFLKPVSALADAVKKVTEGDLDVAIQPKSRDEVGQLARGFNKMTESLRKHIQQVLESQVHLARSEKLASVGQLAAGLAHEINNPINIISGFSELLLKKLPADHPQRSYVEEIDREINRCQKLVQNLLRFSRQPELKSKPCDLNKITEEVLFLLKDKSVQQGINVEYIADKELPSVQGDQDELKQVVLNIALNACQAMPSGGKLRVETKDAATNGHIAIRVSDTGPGIPDDDRNQIFSPFFTTKEQGTGLGLAVSYAIVERHGGKIEVDCPKEGGSVFTVLLPKRSET